MYAKGNLNITHLMQMYSDINNISCSLLNRYSCSSCYGVWRTATEEKFCTETSNPRTCSSMKKESSNWQTLVIQHGTKSSGRSTTRRTKDHLSLNFNPDCKCSLCLTLAGAARCLHCFLLMMHSEFKSEGHLTKFKGETTCNSKHLCALFKLRFGESQVCPYEDLLQRSGDFMVPAPRRAPGLHRVLHIHRHVVSEGKPTAALRHFSFWPFVPSYT